MPVSRSDGALFAEVSYDMMGDKSKSKRVKKINKKINKTGFEVDKQHSGRDVLTLYNPKTNEVVISHKGTTPSRFKDLQADLGIATGTQGKEFKRRTKKTEKALDAHPTAKAYGASHSLGSASMYHTLLTSEKSRDRFDTVHGYNGGASIISSDAEKNARSDPEIKKKVNKIAKHHRVDGDVISASMTVNKPLGTMYTYQEKLDKKDKAKRVAFKAVSTPLAEGDKALNAHGLHHFYNKDQYHNEE